MLTPALVVSLVLMAAGDWRTIGQTAAGDRVSISSVRVLKKNQRLALVRVEYKQPTKLPEGGPFVEMRARVRFNCSSGSSSPTTLWYYTRDRSGRSVVRKRLRVTISSAKNRKADSAKWSRRVSASKQNKK